MAEQTYNPICSTEQYENHFFAKVPGVPSSGFAIVLTCRRGMGEVLLLREEILVRVQNMAHLSIGIGLTNIGLQLRPDPRYVNKQMEIQRLRDKEDYEMERAKIAGNISKLYNSLVIGL